MIQKQKQYIQQFSKKVTNPTFARIEKGMKTSSFTPSSTFVRKIDIFFVNIGKVEYKIFSILL